MLVGPSDREACGHAGQTDQLHQEKQDILDIQVVPRAYLAQLSGVKPRTMWIMHCSPVFHGET